jgi:hypothetical protein
VPRAIAEAALVERLQDILGRTPFRPGSISASTVSAAAMTDTGRGAIHELLGGCRPEWWCLSLAAALNLSTAAMTLRIGIISGSPGKGTISTGWWSIMRISSIACLPSQHWVKN